MRQWIKGRATARPRPLHFVRTLTHTCKHVREAESSEASAQVVPLLLDWVGLSLRHPFVREAHPRACLHAAARDVAVRTAARRASTSATQHSLPWPCMSRAGATGIKWWTRPHPTIPHHR